MRGTQGDPWRFGPSPKPRGLAGRVVPAEVTAARLEGLLARVPVSRVSDLTPLDPLRLPVFAAVTPLARDLTTHMGKGADAVAARVSAVMEAIERTSAERSPGLPVRGSFARLGRRAEPTAIDPRSLELPGDSSYDPESELHWLEGFDLLAGERVLLPADLVVSPPSEGVLREVDTNGLAAGNTRLEAVVHGLCEVIERDVQSQLLFTELFGEPGDGDGAAPEVEPATLPEAPARWIERLRSAGHAVVVQDVTGDVEVATFRARLLDPRFPSPRGPVARWFQGWGTAPDAGAAVLRAVTEAFQSRLGVIQGARDSYNEQPSGRRRASRRQELRALEPRARAPFARTPSFASDDLHADLRFLLDRLRRAGLERVLVFDLTRPDLEIPVVRVRVPGLASFRVNRRRVGWRCLRHLL